MAGDEVHRGPGFAPTPLEQVAGAGQPRCNVGTLSGVAASEAADRIAELVIPFGEAWWVIAKLIAARTEIPWLGDQLEPRQDGILQDRIEEAGVGIEASGFAAERGAEIEAEPVDAVENRPVAQAVQDHLQHARMRDVQRVAAASVVD